MLVSVRSSSLPLVLAIPESGAPATPNRAWTLSVKQVLNSMHSNQETNLNQTPIKLYPQTGKLKSKRHWYIGLMVATIYDTNLLVFHPPDNSTTQLCAHHVPGL